MEKKQQRRMELLDDLLDYALRSPCMSMHCDGPSAPTRRYKTCTRCACIHRAIRMGLVRRVKETYVRNSVVVSAGVLEQHSSVDGRIIT